MTNEKFEDIWDNIILKLFDEITPQKDVFIASRSKYKIYKEYQKQKTFLKLNYMENPNTHLDRHKIAACMLYAIVKVQPIRIKKVSIWRNFWGNKRYSYSFLMLNEYLGLYTAFSIVESFREYEQSIDKCATFQRSGIKLPMTCNGEDYIYNTCLDLYLSKKKNKINILTFANVLFLLEIGEFPEEGNDSLIESEIMK